MIVINILGMLLVVFIAWWFWFYKPKQANVSTQSVKIIVEDGIYQPSQIKLSTGKEYTLQFLRKDASPCAGIVQFPGLGISVELPLGKTKDIKLPIMEPGEYLFHCQMQMYRGSLIVA